MKQTNPMLLIDFYKAVHAEMLPKGITKSVSYFTPRMSRVKRWNEVAMFGLQKIEDLYDLGYLPIEVKALPEGTLVPMHVPMFSIENTHKDFAWLPQALGSLISAEMWHPMIAATVGIHIDRSLISFMK